MPKRTDIHSVLIIGAGPIIIGQACEFDYSGTQACKALKEEGYRVVLVNSNPATIMTDPEFADRTYIEPITPECVEKIIVREKDGDETPRRDRANSFCSPRSAARPRSTPRWPCTRTAPRKTRRGNDRRETRSHPQRRRPFRVQGIDAPDRPRRSHFRRRAQPGRSPRRRRRRSAVSRSSSAPRSRSAARAAASVTTRKSLKPSPRTASSFRP